MEPCVGHGRLLRWLPASVAWDSKGGRGVTISARAELPALVTTIGASEPFPSLDRTFACVQTACLSQIAARGLHERALWSPSLEPPFGAENGSAKPDFAGAPSYVRWAPKAPLLPVSWPSVKRAGSSA